MAYFQVGPDISQGRKIEEHVTICKLGENPETRCDLGEVDTVFYKYYLDKLKADIEAAQSGHKSAITDLRTATGSQHSKWCLLSKANDTYQEYKTLDQCLSVAFDQGSDELAARIKQLEQRDQESVAAFNATHTAIKEMKKKVGDLKDSACKLRYALTDPCNSEQMKALNGQITNADGKKSFEEIVKLLIDQSELACTKANITFEVSVKVAGIHAYLNVASLKPLVEAFAKSVDAFKADVDANLKGAGDEWKKLYDDYLKILRGINSNQLAVRVGKWKQYSLCSTKHYTCDPDTICHPEADASGDAGMSPEARIDKICATVETCFRDDCPPPSNPSKPGPKPGGPVKTTGSRTRDL
ncbi:MAG TPA: hypothetical protein PKL15_15975 [Saprospiraceae bacterium]|nr:hypothetical protein [Saprospiraceae bacterium]HNM26941.1 hypothetical protein [Saprospiraceae bacterium]